MGGSSLRLRGVRKNKPADTGKRDQPKKNRASRYDLLPTHYWPPKFISQK
jgi:hypothetical protein